MHFKRYKSILSAKNGINLYRGCTHGCIYCDSRSRCYQMDHDFEDIEVKLDAPEMLEMALRKKRKKCMIGTGAMCDPYIPLEKELCQTRRCLEVIARYGFGLSILTKSADIMRDIDLLEEIHKQSKCVVQMTLTTADENLCRKIEPRVSTTRERFEVLKEMQMRGIPTVVWLGPILPFINDTEENLQQIVEMCIDAHVYGILCFGMGVTLREGNREYFYDQLDRSFPGIKKRYEETFGFAYHCSNPRSYQLMKKLYALCQKNGIVVNTNRLWQYITSFEKPDCGEQLSFLDMD